VINRNIFRDLLVLGFFLPSFSGLNAQDTNLVQVRAVHVSDKNLHWQRGSELNLGSFPKNVVFTFGLTHDERNIPQRLRARLEGHEDVWHEGNGEMYLRVRFYNANGDRIAENTFTIHGESVGWNGTLASSPASHRREILVVPPGASSLWVVISSAGPPSTIGIYVVHDLVVSRLSPEKDKAEVLIKSPFDSASNDSDENPVGWERDGTRPSMGKIVEIGQNPKQKTLAIIDDSPLDHAEWHNTKEFAPKVTPNESLYLEWDEMYSMGVSDNRYVAYSELPPGNYKFRVSKVSIFGEPSGKEAILAVHVSQPYWKMPWFWPTLTTGLVGVAVLSLRYITRRKMRHAMALLEQQRVLEQERLRISQDIHDDLGARVTQISLLSAMAQKDSAFSEKARVEFERISQMSQELIAALYETVWTVNPENDNLDAMVDYLCQRINDLCTQAGLSCRLNISPIPKNVEISSRSRHNISMATREAVHNVTKHAKATQVTVFITFAEGILSVSIHDDGCGFQPESGSRGGHGLPNMQKRMEYIGGTCEIESVPGNGTKVHFRVAIGSQRDAPAQPVAVSN
jgi:signal transduction histidine kinase